MTNQKDGKKLSGQMAWRGHTDRLILGTRVPVEYEYSGLQKQRVTVACVGITG